jgi:hypothetical protein
MDPDFLDLLREFARADVRFLVVGGYAVGVHGHVRATKDLDLWVDASAENAPRVIRALRAFGAPLVGLTEAELATPGKGLMIGVPPTRIDVLTKIDGLTFTEAWPGHIEARFGEASVPVLGREELLKNKRASGRLQDLADVEALERLALP